MDCPTRHCDSNDTIDKVRHHISFVVRGDEAADWEIPVLPRNNDSDVRKKWDFHGESSKNGELRF